MARTIGRESYAECRTRIFHFDHYTTTGFPGFHVEHPPVGIASRALAIRLENTLACEDVSMATRFPQSIRRTLASRALCFAWSHPSDEAISMQDVQAVSTICERRASTCARIKRTAPIHQPCVCSGKLHNLDIRLALRKIDLQTSMILLPRTGRGTQLDPALQCIKRLHYWVKLVQRHP
jgi:hypothetical protein